MEGCWRTKGYLKRGRDGCQSISAGRELILHLLLLAADVGGRCSSPRWSSPVRRVVLGACRATPADDVCHLGGCHNALVHGQLLSGFSVRGRSSGLISTAGYAQTLVYGVLFKRKLRFDFCM